jgi:hypothetical protein
VKNNDSDIAVQIIKTVDKISELAKKNANTDKQMIIVNFAMHVNKMFFLVFSISFIS